MQMQGSEAVWQPVLDAHLHCVYPGWRPPCAEGKIQFGFVPANVKLGKPVGSGPGGKLVVVEMVMY